MGTFFLAFKDYTAAIGFAALLFVLTGPTNRANGFESTVQVGYGGNNQGRDEKGSLAVLGLNWPLSKATSIGMQTIGEGQQEIFYRMSSLASLSIQATSNWTATISGGIYSESWNSHETVPGKDHSRGRRFQLGSEYGLWETSSIRVVAGGFRAVLLHREGTRNRDTKEKIWIAGATLGITFCNL